MMFAGDASQWFGHVFGVYSHRCRRCRISRAHALGKARSCRQQQVRLANRARKRKRGWR